MEEFVPMLLRKKGTDFKFMLKNAHDAFLEGKIRVAQRLWRGTNFSKHAKNAHGELSLCSTRRSSPRRLGNLAPLGFLVSRQSPCSPRRSSPADAGSDNCGIRRADSETSLRSVSSCHGSRRDTDNKKKGMALSKLSHAFLFVVVVAARC